MISSFLTMVMGSIGVTPLRRKNMGGRRRRSIDSNHKTIPEVSSKRKERKWKSVSHEGTGEGTGKIFFPREGRRERW